MIQHDVSLTPDGGPDGLVRCGIAVLVAASRANVGVKSGRPLGSNEDEFCLQVYIYVVNEATSRMDDSMKHQ